MHVTIWVNLSDTRLSENRHKLYDSSYMKFGYDTKISCGDRNQSLPRAMESMTVKQYEETFWKKGNVLYLYWERITWVYTFV